MAYTPNTLSALTFTVEGAVKEWMYLTTDPIATFTAAGYLADAGKRGMQVGDLVWVNNQATPDMYLCKCTSVASFASGGGASIALANAIGPTGAISLITLPVQLADLAAGSLAVDVPFNGKLTAVNFRVVKPGAGTGATATCQAQVNGISLTGGIVTPTLANTATQGAQVAGTAITAGIQTFTAGQTVGLLISAVTAFTAGDGFFEFTLVNTDINVG